MKYQPTTKEFAQLANQFMHHAPRGDQAQRYEALRAKGREMAEMILSYCPPCPERDQAIDNIRLAVMTANAAIACNEPPPAQAALKTEYAQQAEFDDRPWYERGLSITPPEKPPEKPYDPNQDFVGGA